MTSSLMSGYFDDAHRGLQRQQHGLGGLSTSASNVQLPPLRPDSGPPAVGERESAGWEKGAGLSLQESKWLGSLELSHEQAARGLQVERYQQALQESSNLSRRVRALQDQLAITSAKKEAFKTQAQRLEREFRKGREQSDSLQRDLLEAKRESGQLSKEAQEAVTMMGEMRKAHIQEVRLLQRGLAARAGDEKMKNRVNEVADLVDKVGKAVVQRDEAIREKTKFQVHLNRSLNELRTSTDDSSRLRKQNKQLSESLKEAQRKAKYTPPQPGREPPEDSDEEFESELCQFERRFEILEEGPAGLDILASNLSKDKASLEKRLRQQNETARSLNVTIESWKRLGAEKDQTIKDLSGKLQKMLRDQAMLEEQIASKRREIELQVADEKAALEERVKELELECDNARAAADGMEKASTRLSRELVKVHEQYAGAPGAALGATPEVAGAEAAAPAPAAGAEAVVLHSAEQFAKTGELLKLQVVRVGEATTLRAQEASGGEEFTIPVGPELTKELDEADPWMSLCRRACVDAGPPRRVVVSSRLGEKEVELPPAGTQVLLTAYQYGAQRYYLEGVEFASQRLLDLTVTGGSMPPGLEARLAQCGSDGGALFDALVGSLALDAADVPGLSLASPAVPA